MSAGLDFTAVSSLSAGEINSWPQPPNSTAMSRVEGRRVVRSPEQLRLHRALDELGWAGRAGDVNDAIRPTNAPASEPILITTNCTILAGFGQWRLALFEGRREIPCIEYRLDEEESLQFILNHHMPRSGWNAFVRIRLALTLEPYLQQRALENMRVGGRFKGLANLPEARQIDARQEIACLAGVGARNVSSVKTILKNAHPRLVAALLNDTLSINAATQLCKWPKAEQLENFIRYNEDREVNKVVRRAVARPKKGKTNTDLLTVFVALRQKEVRHPGSVLILPSRLQHTVILVGQDLSTELCFQKEVYEIPRSPQGDSIPHPTTLGPRSNPCSSSPGFR